MAFKIVSSLRMHAMSATFDRLEPDRPFAVMALGTGPQVGTPDSSGPVADPLAA